LLPDWSIAASSPGVHDAVVVYHRPVGRVWLTEPPEQASWDRAGSPGQLRLARFLAHADALASPLLAGAGTVRG
jgi:hypothetical protein